MFSLVAFAGATATLLPDVHAANMYGPGPQGVPPPWPEGAWPEGAAEGKARASSSWEVAANGNGYGNDAEDEGFNALVKQVLRQRIAEDIKAVSGPFDQLPAELQNRPVLNKPEDVEQLIKANCQAKPFRSTGTFSLATKVLRSYLASGAVDHVTMRKIFQILLANETNRRSDQDKRHVYSCFGVLSNGGKLGEPEPGQAVLNNPGAGSRDIQKPHSSFCGPRRGYLNGCDLRVRIKGIMQQVNLNSKERGAGQQQEEFVSKRDGDELRGALSKVIKLLFGQDGHRVQNPATLRQDATALQAFAEFVVRIEPEIATPVRLQFENVLKRAEALASAALDEVQSTAQLRGGQQETAKKTIEGTITYAIASLRWFKDNAEELTRAKTTFFTVTEMDSATRDFATEFAEKFGGTEAKFFPFSLFDILSTEEVDRLFHISFGAEAEKLRDTLVAGLGEIKEDLKRERGNINAASRASSAADMQRDEEEDKFKTDVGVAQTPSVGVAQTEEKENGEWPTLRTSTRKKEDRATPRSGLNEGMDRPQKGRGRGQPLFRAGRGK